MIRLSHSLSFSASACIFFLLVSMCCSTFLISSSNIVVRSVSCFIRSSSTLSRIVARLDFFPLLPFPVGPLPCSIAFVATEGEPGDDDPSTGSSILYTISSNVVSGSCSSPSAACRRPASRSSSSSSKDGSVLFTRTAATILVPSILGFSDREARLGTAAPGGDRTK
uniref:Uncharacterized protein n=1 Tax=Anopheles darlingi TaxID=43151 RepID=A0A2M4D4N0_ANODA